LDRVKTRKRKRSRRCLLDSLPLIVPEVRREVERERRAREKVVLDEEDIYVEPAEHTIPILSSAGRPRATEEELDALGIERRRSFQDYGVPKTTRQTGVNEKDAIKNGLIFYKGVCDGHVIAEREGRPYVHFMNEEAAQLLSVDEVHKKLSEYDFSNMGIGLRKSAGTTAAWDLGYTVRRFTNMRKLLQSRKYRSYSRRSGYPAVLYKRSVEHPDLLPLLESLAIEGTKAFQRGAPDEFEAMRREHDEHELPGGKLWKCERERDERKERGDDTDGADRVLHLAANLLRTTALKPKRCEGHRDKRDRRFALHMTLRNHTRCVGGMGSAGLICGNVHLPMRPGTLIMFDADVLVHAVLLHRGFREALLLYHKRYMDTARFDIDREDVV